MPDTREIAIKLAPTTAQLNMQLNAAAAGNPDPAAIINLIAELLPSAIGLYQTLTAQYSGPSKSVEEILGTADANWDAISAAAKGQLG